MDGIPMLLLLSIPILGIFINKISFHLLFQDAEIQLFIFYLRPYTSELITPFLIDIA